MLIDLAHNAGFCYGFHRVKTATYCVFFTFEFEMIPPTQALLSLLALKSGSSVHNATPSPISWNRRRPCSNVWDPGDSLVLRFSAPPRRLIIIKAIPIRRAPFFDRRSFRGPPEAAVFRAVCIPRERRLTRRAFQAPRAPAVPTTSDAKR
jgi:hypothetical protein